MNTAVTSLPPTPSGHASATAGAGLRLWFSRAGRSVWNRLEAVGRLRAHRYLTDFADQCEAQQPALAKELRAASRQGPMA